MKQVSLIHGVDGLYRLSLGKYVSNGKTAYKKFRLGSDKIEAEKMAAALQVAWAQETQTDSAGEKVWSDESISKAKAFALGTPVVQQTPAPEPTPSNSEPKPIQHPTLCAQKGLLLHKALDLWLGEMESRFTAKDISQAHYDSCG